MLVTGSCKKEIKNFKGDPIKEFKMYDLSNISYFIGIEFYMSSRDLMMDQRRFTSEILKIFEMKDCNATSTPFETRLKLMKDLNEDDVDPTQYKRLIRSLR